MWGCEAICQMTDKNMYFSQRKKKENMFWSGLFQFRDGWLPHWLPRLCLIFVLPCTNYHFWSWLHRCLFAFVFCVQPPKCNNTYKAPLMLINYTINDYVCRISFFFIIVLFLHPQYLNTLFVIFLSLCMFLCVLHVYWVSMFLEMEQIIVLQCQPIDFFSSGAYVEPTKNFLTMQREWG